MRALKREHLEGLRKMILGQNAQVADGLIKSDDIPIEYIVMFALAFIAAMGGLVA